MSKRQQQNRPATAAEIREIVGPCDEDLLARIIDVRATREEVLEAFTWLHADDYLHRRLHRTLSGRPAHGCDLLEAELVEEDRR